VVSPELKVIIKRVKWVLPIYSLNTHHKGGREKAEQTGIMYHLHDKYVVVPADKTPNKIVFTLYGSHFRNMGATWGD
jgi:hypothetical protein